MMKYTATWFAAETAISTDTAGTLAAAREMARSRLIAHKVRSGATHVEVRSDSGALMFSSSAGMMPARARRPTFSAQFVKRWAAANISPT